MTAVDILNCSVVLGPHNMVRARGGALVVFAWRERIRVRSVLLLNAVPLLTDIVCFISFRCSAGRAPSEPGGTR